MTCADPKCVICRPARQAQDDRFNCVDHWRAFQKQAEAIVDVEDPIARNRRINAAYATLWLDDRRFQWAGLAAFASKQVGCGLLNAAELIGKSNRQREAYRQWEQGSSPLERLSPYASPRMPMHDLASAEGAIKVYRMLAQGNTALFLDIWPLHMFYKKFGLRQFERCLVERAQLRGTVRWSIKDVPFADPTTDVREAFRAIDSGDLAGGVALLARHEQLNILQPAMYADPAFMILMRANQLAWALNIPTSSSREIQLTLANQCTVTGANARIERFSGQPLANLADPIQRMAFVMRAAERFNDLLNDPVEKYLVESSILVIANPR